MRALSEHSISNGFQRGLALVQLVSDGQRAWFAARVGQYEFELVEYSTSGDVLRETGRSGSFPGLPRVLFLEDGVVHAVAFEGIYSFDVRTPGAPKQLWFGVSRGGHERATGIESDGRFLYIGTEAGLRIIEQCAPSPPRAGAKGNDCRLTQARGAPITGAWAFVYQRADRPPPRGPP